MANPQNMKKKQAAPIDHGASTAPSIERECVRTSTSARGLRLLGTVTERDITVRGAAANLRPDEACVSGVMTPVN